MVTLLIHLQKIIKKKNNDEHHGTSYSEDVYYRADTHIFINFKYLYFNTYYLTFFDPSLFS